MIGPSGNTDASTPSHASTDANELAALRQDFPAFRIWQEIMSERVRYVARSQHPDARPHTVVTADPDELRAVLGGAPAVAPAPLAPSQRFDTRAPNIARVYDRWLGGKDNFDADRQAADAVAAQFPEITDVAKANRAFSSGP